MSDLLIRIRAKLPNDRVGQDYVGRPMLAPEPASLSAVASCEQKMGLPFPPLLRSILLKVANGGLGPGYGIIGVHGGHKDGHFSIADLLIDIHEIYESDSPSKWRKGWLPICHWGCGIYSVVDCEDPYTVYTVEPYEVPSGKGIESATWRWTTTFEQWIEYWLEDVDLWKMMHTIPD